jgi:methionyl-tRNA formyltransferase
MKYLLVTDKKWHDDLFENLKRRMPRKWLRIRKRSEFHSQLISKLKPEWIFIPHWSDMIPSDIYGNYNCVVFHMTDLPFGRGGSPLQNLIERGYKKTFISAIRVRAGLDAGPVFLKAPLSLDGSAKDIFNRSAPIIEKMILKILKTNPAPREQKGDVVIFKRRTPDQSNIENLTSIEKIFDHIRMLDCEGYPSAYLEINKLRLEFSNAQLENDKTVIANVKISTK